MSLLALDRVTKRYDAGGREVTALRNVSLDLAAGELVAVWGLRRSGRTTLVRIAAGIETPDEGAVLLDGLPIGERRRGALGRELAYVSTNFPAAQGGAVGDQVAVPLIARGVHRRRARAVAEETLRRVGAPDLGRREARELDPAELVLAGLARALMTSPRVLLLDDPTGGVDLIRRDEIHALIRTVADDGTAVLMTVGDAIEDADRVLSLTDGELRGDVAPASAPVVALRPPRAERA